MAEDDSVVMSNSSQLKYMTPKSQNKHVSKVADTHNNLRQQHVANENPVLNTNSSSENNVVNIQLNYDINQTLDLESWDSNFQAISLHSSIEHLVSDIKNIKDSLIRMHKYILGKSINGDKANSIKDLEGIGKEAWEFYLFPLWSSLG